MKIVKIILLFLILIIIVSIFFAFNWYSTTLTKVNGTDNSTVSFEIKSGSGASTIGEQLYEKKLILDLNVWKIYTKLNNPKLLADTYSLPKNLNMLDLIALLGKGQEDEVVWVTIPEGKTTKQIIEIFQKKVSSFDGNFDIDTFKKILAKPDDYINNGKFDANVVEFIQKYKPNAKPLEGFFYPETYAFPTKSSAEGVVNMVLQQFIKVTKDLNLPEEDHKFYDVLTLASIVERESRDENDRPYVASVFSNRLKINMLLQSDGTIVYLTGKNDPRPTYADLKIESPYNTYIHTGLPPTPISNPRLHSIEVSLNPIKTDYYYFIHEPNGTAHYGKTLGDHNHNVCKYLDKSCN
jgi:UPF0755 protein